MNGPVTLLATLLLAPVLPGDPGDWPQWRGALGDGLSHDVPWSPEGRTLWTTSIGLGYSSPSVSAGRVLTLGFDVERSVDRLLALDLETGRELWRQEWPGQLRDNQHEGGSLSTPAVFEGVVYVSTTEGELCAFDLEDGAPRWRADFREELGLDPQYYGFAGSPVLEPDPGGAGGPRLYAALDRVLAVDAGTGERLWETEPLDARYSTPALFTSGERPCLAVLSQNALHLIPRTGSGAGTVLAAFPWHKSDRLVNAATPVVLGNSLFVSSAYDHGCARVDFSGPEPRALWESRRMRTKMAGCVALEGGIFGFDESVLRALDLEGGEHWSVRGLGNGALSGGDGKLAILSSEGELIVARATLESFEELARVDLFDEGVCWTPPVIAGGRIYARNNRGTLVCRDHRVLDAARASPDTESGPDEAAGTLDAPVPAAAALVAEHAAALGNAEALRTHPTVHLVGTYEQRSVGFVPVAFEIWNVAPGATHAARRLVQIHFPAPIQGFLTRVFDGEIAFEVNAYRGNKLLEGGDGREEALAARLAWPAGWQGLVAPDAIVRAAEFGRRPCWRVETTAEDGEERTLYFERSSGLLAGREGANEGLVTYDDYRVVEGLRIAYFLRVYRPESGIEETFRVETVTFDAPDETRFERPER